jgi:hypothetical protein
MSKKKASSKFKLSLNKIICKALADRGIKYVNMTQACSDLCRALGIGINHVNSIEDRRRIVELLTGKEPVDVCQIIRFERSAAKRIKISEMAPKPRYLPGKPSASTLERDIKSFYESWDWKRLSFDVKQERGRKCECCGAKAPDVRIITDHIKPIRHHWHLRLERSNLQILCDDCNMGKGSRDETDFRPVLWTETDVIEPKK